MASLSARLSSSLAAAFASSFLLAPIAHSAARSLPEDVSVKAFAKLDRGRLELLVRVPLAAVKDIQFPVRGDAGYLDLNAVKSMLPGAARYWIAGCFEVFEDGVAVAKPEIARARISLRSDQSFLSYAAAIAHLDGPDIAPGTDVFWDQVWLDIRFVFSTKADRPLVSIRPKLAGLGVRVSTDLKYVEPDGGIRDFAFEGDPGLTYMDARWRDAARQFLQWGFRFVANSSDFLLFLFCLALPLRRYRDILPAVAAFVGALSLTCLASASGLVPDAVWLRPLIETSIAVAILSTAIANIAGRVRPGRRALLALGSGLVFGFGCSFDLAAKIQFGGAHSIVASVAYDAGVVFAAMLVIALLVPVLSFLFRFARTERVELIVVSALAADTAWGWLAERWARLNKVPFHAPAFDIGMLALTMRWLMVLVLAGGVFWFVQGWLKSRRFAREEQRVRDENRTVV
jgi:hypothetical protein